MFIGDFIFHNFIGLTVISNFIQELLLHLFDPSDQLNALTSLGMFSTQIYFRMFHRLFAHCQIIHVDEPNPPIASFLIFFLSKGNNNKTDQE